MVLDKSSSKKAFAGKKVRYLSYLLAGALSREGQLLTQMARNELHERQIRVTNSLLHSFFNK